MNFDIEKIKEECRKKRIPTVAFSVIENMDIKQKDTISLSQDLLEDPSDIPFQMGSISKLVTAWVVLLLEEMGKLNIDDPINHYLKQWKIEGRNVQTDDISIKMVLSHYAGLNHKSFLGVRNKKSLKSTMDYLNAKKVSCIYPIDRRPIYSGGGYVVLQLLIEQVSGMDLSDFTEKYIFGPLKMHNTTFNTEKVCMDKLPNCYDLLGKKIKNRYYSEKAAAGLYSTIDDISKFAIENMNYNNIIISDKLKMIQKRYDRVYPNCLGCDAFNASGKKLIVSKGINLGWFACILLLPNEGNGFVYLSNSNRGSKLFSILSKEWMDNNNFIAERNKMFRYL